MKITSILMGCAALMVLPVSADDTPLGKQMEAFNDSYKAFRKETDPAKGAAQAREAQNTILKAIGESPSMLAKMPEGPAKTKALTAYRKMMGRLFVTLCEVEQAFLADDKAQLAKLLDTLKSMKKEGHNQFMEDE